MLPISSDTKVSKCSSAFTRSGGTSRRTDSPRLKKPSPKEHPELAGNRRQTMGSKGKESNGLCTGATPETSGGSEVFAKIGSASSQAGRRRFDPGRPLHYFSTRSDRDGVAE